MTSIQFAPRAPKRGLILGQHDEDFSIKIRSTGYRAPSKIFSYSIARSRTATFAAICAWAQQSQRGNCYGVINHCAVYTCCQASSLCHADSWSSFKSPSWARMWASRSFPSSISCLTVSTEQRPSMPTDTCAQESRRIAPKKRGRLQKSSEESGKIKEPEKFMTMPDLEPIYSPHLS